ncbi:MAG: DUF3299 domain-containing protein [Pseudomonadota bacterium]
MTKWLWLLWLSLFLAPLSAQVAASDAKADKAAQTYRTVDWTELIPPDVLEILLNPPAYITDMEDGSIEDQISSQIKSSIAADDDPYQQALVSTEVNDDMNGENVRIPGFVVPLEFDETQTVTQFFLVPYFGACLHMPPPPPNQIILVSSKTGLQVQELYTPFWISGKLATTLSENDLATSAYSMTMEEYEIYTE